MNRRLVVLLLTLAATVGLARYSAVVRQQAGFAYFLQAVELMRPGSHITFAVGDW